MRAKQWCLPAKMTFLSLLGLLAMARMMTADEPASKAGVRPPWQRLLRGDDAKQAAALQARVNEFIAAGKYADAIATAKQLAALRERLQGPDHWQAADARRQVKDLEKQSAWDEQQRQDGRRAAAAARDAAELEAMGRHGQAKPLRQQALALCRRLWGEEHPNTAAAYNDLAINLNAQGQYAEAEGAFRKALALYRKLLGEEHHDTATTYHNLASSLKDQGRYAEAEGAFRKALALCRTVLGEEDPDTATAYSSLGVNLNLQGRYAEAEEAFRKALALYRKLLGEEHPGTASAYNGLAVNLNAQGRYAEAESAIRKALALHRKLLGEGHPDIALAYNNLALNLEAQGRYAEAEGAFRKALALRRKLLGEGHPYTATAYLSLASSLNAQGRYAEAEETFRQALALCRKLLGEGHPYTAAAYNSLAANLYKQGRYAEAEAAFREALALRRKLLGEEHPDTAAAYNGLAANLTAQGRYAEAEEAFRKALALYRKLLGEEHPNTAAYKSLAVDLAAQGRDREAEEQLRHAADTFARARPRFATSGLGAAGVTGNVSPLPFLAALLARHAQPAEAWRRFEQGLGRGTWDDLHARLARSPEEQAAFAALTRRLERLDQLLAQDATLKKPSEEQARRRQEWLAQQREALDQLDALTRESARKHGLGEAQALPLEKIQAALPADTALLGWVDAQAEGKAAEKVNERWAVLLRAKGPPAWFRLPGSGPGGAWTEADTRLPRDLVAALRSRPQPGAADWHPLAEQLYRQRLTPAEPHLAATAGLPAVHHLVVLPSDPMDGIPLSVLTDRYSFSRAPSATMFAFLHGKPKPSAGGLLALANPVFDRPTAGASPAPLPPGGVLLTAVVPGSSAARAGLRAGDVLLRYGDAELKAAADLKPLPPAADAQVRVPVKAWREGEPFTAEVAPGPLGVSLAREPAPEAVARRRRIDAELVAGRGGKWEPLPGTRVEAAAVAGRFRAADRPVTLLTDSDASEQRLAALAADGTLRKARYLHLATHGDVNRDFHLQSALILSQDRLPDPFQQLDAGLPAFDGRLTAAEVLRDWDLDADLVALSACDTGLGRYAQGEGYLGFEQAFLLAGSRSVILSLWQVNDVSTALLMDRFYANLLGQRHGLQAPLGKAEALAEAQQWLRTLPRAEALRRAAALTGGVERGKGRKALPRRPAVPETTNDAPPFAHPYYWAAFVLVGDPG